MVPMAKTSPKAKPKPEPANGTTDHLEMQTTAIHITKQDWNLLRSVAYHRAENTGGRASVSEVVRALIEASRNELEREIEREQG